MGDGLGALGSLFGAKKEYDVTTPIVPSYKITAYLAELLRESEGLTRMPQAFLLCAFFSLQVRPLPCA